MCLFSEGVLEGFAVVSRQKNREEKVVRWHYKCCLVKLQWKQKKLYDDNKNIDTITLIVIAMLLRRRNLKALSRYRNSNTIPIGQAVFYGKFIQRLGFSSGGFPQDIRLVNLETNEVFSFRVKPTFKSARENTFCYIIKPGNYAILNYWWTKSKWDGGDVHTEPIYKGIDATVSFDKKIKSGRIKQDELVQFTFSIVENSLSYVGTWNFDTGLVSFTDDKEQFDSKIKNKYKKLDFSNAKIVLPS